MSDFYDESYYFGRKKSNYLTYQLYALRLPWRSVIKTIAMHGKGGTFLDIGCAFGYLANFAKPYFTKVIGIDISSYAAAQAKRNFPDIDFRVADITKGLPFEDGAFNFISAVDVLEHIKSPERAVQEISRLLSGGGVFFFRVPYYGLLRKILGRFDVDKSHISIQTPETWNTNLRDNGFNIISEKKFPSLIGGQLTVVAVKAEKNP